MQRKKTRIYNILIVICALVLLLCALMIFWKTRDYRAGDSAYSDTATLAVRPRATGAAATVPPATPDADGVITLTGQDTPAVEYAPIEVDFSKLEAVRGTVAGWLYCEGTVLNYPVAGGKTNEYYLSHLLDGARNSMGTLYIDDDNAADFSDRNTIIHGHHMKNGSMFGWLESYRDQAFYEAHPAMYLLTPDGDYRLELLAGYTSEAAGSAYRQWFEDDAAFLAFMEAAMERSDFQTHAVVEPTDRIVTLSTCAYVFENARYVVHARLVPLG